MFCNGAAMLRGRRRREKALFPAVDAVEAGRVALLTTVAATESSSSGGCGTLGVPHRFASGPRSLTKFFLQRHGKPRLPIRGSGGRGFEQNWLGPNQIGYSVWLKLVVFGLV